MMMVLDSFRLDGKVAVVTGGAGLYGRQIAEALGEAGARTFMASRDVEKLEAQARTFRDAGLDVSAMTLDQSQERSCRDLLNCVTDRAGRPVDVLINNSVLRPMRRWGDPAEAFAKSMEVNATGIFMMTRLFGEHMAGNGGGSIVMVGSMQGMIGPDFTLYEGMTYNGLPMDAPPDYFFHKGGMINFTRYAAAKLGPRGVRVNCISPGGYYDQHDPGFLERYNARTFLGRMANSSDLKGVIVFLASDASAYVTGANIPVDGGYTAK